MRPNSMRINFCKLPGNVGRNVGIRSITTDRYGRTVAELFVNGSATVQQQLVAAAHAEIDWRYAHQCHWA